MNEGGADEAFLKQQTTSYEKAWLVSEQLSKSQCIFDGTAEFHNDKYELIASKGEAVETVVRVLDVDPIKLSDKLEREKDISAVIAISGCQNKWGGGADSNQPGVEEDMCRRSNMFYALDKTQNSLFKHGEVLPTNAFYCTGIDVFATTDFKITKETIPIDVISCVVSKSPSVVGYVDGRQEYQESSDRARMAQCFTNIFRIAEINDYDAVIINQIGIELDRHPVHGVAKVLSEVIAKTTVKYVFYIYPKPDNEDTTDLRDYRAFFAEVDNTRPKEVVLSEFDRELEQQRANQIKREKEARRRQRKEKERKQRKREKERDLRGKELLAEAKKDIN